MPAVLKADAVGAAAESAASKMLAQIKTWVTVHEIKLEVPDDPSKVTVGWLHQLAAASKSSGLPLGNLLANRCWAYCVLASHLKAV